MEEHPNTPTFQSSAQYCRYGARKIYTFVQAMAAEIPGVRIARDIECIHKMRVVSRRTRSGLKLFKSCFPGTVLKRWQKGVRGVTKNLGAVRDLDVQIQVLKEFRKTNTQFEYQLGVNHILYHIRQKRRVMQKDVIQSIDKMEKRGLLHELVAYLEKTLVKNTFLDTARSSQFVLYQARTNILEHLDGLLEYRQYAGQEDADDELHQMRIAAKRLRYTLEIFSDLYEDDLNGYIKAVKKIQKFLGEMHDCVVWLAYLPKFLKVERKHSARYQQADQRYRSIERGVRYFEGDRKQFRLKRYRDFFEHWQQIIADDTFGKLRRYLAEKTADSKR